MFRSVRLLPGIPGRLYLHSIPGRRESWEEFIDGLVGAGIDLIVSLTPQEEIERESPAYARAIAGGTLPARRMVFPIPDYGIPADREGYAGFVAEVADLIRAGGAVLVHCNGGIGRTGTFAACLLISFGAGAAEALERVGSAGSHPEEDVQKELISWYEGFVRGDGI